MFQPGELSPRVRNAAAAAIQHSWEWICAVGATGPDDAHGKRFRSMGERSMLAFPPGQLFGQHWIEIGAFTLIGPHVSMSVGFWNEELDPAAPPVIRIGDRCNIGRGGSLVGRVGITIGDDVTIAPNVYITDHNHAYDDVDVPIKDQWPVADAVSIGAGSWIGTGAIILPGTALGEHVTVAGGSVVRGDVPDRSVVAGVPGKVVRRWVDGRWDPPLDGRTDPVPDEWRT
ncbi:MAG TPA: acyltransferase [Acidimicrobiales bacterium]|nr:acyltransferase [Acidimicrobiales bacterium]